MSYITLQGLIDRYGEAELIQLTDVLDAGVVDTDKIDRAIADADAEIDAYLAGRMTLPMATVPTVLERVAGAMVRYYLYKDAVTDLIKDQYTAAIKFLANVANGTAQLGPSVSGGAIPNVAEAAHAAPARVFDDFGMDGYA